MPEAGEQILGKKLIMPEKEPKKPVPLMGKKSTDKSASLYQEHSEDFVFKTL